MSCPRKRIILHYTKEELERLEQYAQDTEGTSFGALMFRRIIRFSTFANGHVIEAPVPKSAIDMYIPGDTSCRIMELSKRFGIPPATLVGRYVISPLLAECYEAHITHP